MRELEQVAIAFAAACDEARVPYAFVGGVAVMAWGIPRATVDVDAILQLAHRRIEPLAACLAKHGLDVSAADLRDSLQDGSHVTIHDRDGPYHVDVKHADSAEMEAEVEAARTIEFEGHRLRVASAEDTIAWKLRFGSPRDLEDVRAILVRQEGRLDTARLEAVARRLGVWTDLDALR